MNPTHLFHEKLFFGAITLASSAASMLGAILTTGETRWLYVTISAGIMTSGFLALMFKKAEESIKLVTGRCGVSVLGGVLATRPALKALHLVDTDLDVIALGGYAAAVTVVTFFVGFALLSMIEKKAPAIAESWLKKFVP